MVDLADRRALERYRPADAEVMEQARRLKEAALLDFGLTESAVASWLYAKCHHQLATTAVDTAAVVASGDGSCLLLYNPDFFVRLGLDGVKFVLFHEARHLVQRHLFAEPELRADPVFEVATEVSINHVALVRLGRDEMPLLDDRPTGIDPRKVHEAYREDLLGQGLEPVTYGEFTETDLTVYGELKRMRQPPVPAEPSCAHLLTDVPADQETVDEVTSSALLNALLAARRGHTGAEQELLDLMGRTEGASARTAKIWGRLGAGVLRGETSRTRTVDWWQRWLVDVLGSKLRDGERLVYPKKRGALLAALGQDPMLAARPGAGQGARHRVRHLGFHAEPGDRVAHRTRRTDRRGRGTLAVLRHRGDALRGGRTRVRRRRHELPGRRRLRGRAHRGERPSLRGGSGRRGDAHRRTRPADHARRARQVDLADHRGRS